MSTAITGVVNNGVILPGSRLPEGAEVEVTVVAADKAAQPFGSEPD